LDVGVTENNDQNKIDLGGLTVSTGSSSNHITFQCVYPVSVTVTSDTFSVNSAAASGVQTGSGNLADGFSLMIGDGSDAEIVLGQMLDVAVTWEVTLPDVNFYLRNCYLEQGTSTVNVIKDGCLSEALQVSYTSPLQNSQSFQMVIFSIEGEESNQQFIGCKIKLCMDTCDKPTSDDQCPDDQNYLFSLMGN